MTGFILDFAELFIVYAVQYGPGVASAVNAAICFVGSLPFLYGGYFLFRYLKKRKEYNSLLLTLSITLLCWFGFFLFSAFIYVLNDSINILEFLIPLTLLGYIYTLPFLVFGFLLLKVLKSRLNLPTFISLGPVAYTCFFVFWIIEILVMKPGV
jgi:hypothetical protein